MLNTDDCLPDVVERFETLLDVAFVEFPLVRANVDNLKQDTSL